MSIKWKIQEYKREEEIEVSLLNNSVSDQVTFYDFKSNLDVTGLSVRRADMLIIDNNLKFWGLVEVETSKHSFNNHIFPQLLELNQLIESNSFQLSDEILKKYNDLNHSQRRLIKYNKPFLFLVIDNDFDLYKNICKNLCSIISLQRFVSNDYQYAYRFQITLESKLQFNYCFAIVSLNFLSVSNPDLINLNESIGDVIHFYHLDSVIIARSLGRSHERIANHYPVIFEIIQNDSRTIHGKFYAKIKGDDQVELSKSV